MLLATFRSGHIFPAFMQNISFVDSIIHSRQLNIASIILPFSGGRPNFVVNHCWRLVPVDYERVSLYLGQIWRIELLTMGSDAPGKYKGQSKSAC